MSRPHSSTFVRMLDDVLAGDVRAAELRDRVVAVFAEDTLRRAFPRALWPRRRRSARHPSRSSATLLGELVEKQPAQRLGRARVPREERALDRFRQVGQRENVAVEIGEVRGETRAFVA